MDNQPEEVNKKAIGFQFKLLSNMIKRKMNEFIDNDEEIHLTGMQGWMVGYIYRRSSTQDVFQRDIEKEFRIRRSTATGILQTLESKGYIERHAVAEDARLKKIVLTDKAIKESKCITGKIIEFDKVVEDGITEEEKEVFFQMIEKIKQNMNY